MNTHKFKTGEIYTTLELREGYREITGLDDKELTDKQIVEYMTTLIEEDGED